MTTPMTGHDEAADDGVQQAAGAAGRRRHLGEDGGAEAGKPFQNSAPRMSASMPRPTVVATSDSAIQTLADVGAPVVAARLRWSA